MNFDDNSAFKRESVDELIGWFSAFGIGFFGLLLLLGVMA